MLNRISFTTLLALVVVFGICIHAHAADVDKLLRLDSASGLPDGPEMWAKLYPLPAYEYGLTASG